MRYIHAISLILNLILAVWFAIENTYPHSPDMLFPYFVMGFCSFGIVLTIICFGIQLFHQDSRRRRRIQ